MSSTELHAAPVRRPSAADFYAVNRGGGLFSEALSQRLGAVFALVAERTGLKPTTLTLANLVLGLTVSTLLVVRGQGGLVLGLLALVGWQVAYSLDCADGQLARVTKQGSLAGARIDILCDVAAQIGLVTALVAVARPPVWLAALFAGSWMVNLVTSVLATGDKAQSMVTSTSLPVRLVKLVRDYGAVIFVAGLVLAFAPALTIWFVAAFTVVNFGFLLASIAFTARSAYRG
ncbi:CDP-alcohol phosphatidyltransferase family protein [Catellatospora sp. KI3]|uniref:CDP-alcohol phosphatidyltransferase family protein n=1 Tax=Catellatospora sp. KI3 TaxID=3041620 RepID=UPI002482A8DD|nr:CDP-alcohol phosphatidyltransferase family protein [Catellatospora sp. KI3]MDI1464246.1 CDP-alcohol phosphatidyltransferase family protein [Catellatospora sp. KI3]